MSGADEEESAGRSGLPRLRWPLLLLVTLGVYGVALAAAGIEDVAAAIAGASPLYLVAGLLLQVVVTLTWPQVHRASVRSVGHDVSYAGALNVSMSAFTVSHAVPGGGAVGAGVAVERLTTLGLPGPAATASATLTGPVSLTTIVGLATGGVTAAVLAGELPPVMLGLAVLGLVGLCLLLGSIVAGIRSPAAGERVIDTLGRLHPRLERRTDRWRRSWRGVTEQAPTLGNVARIFAWSLGKWVADIGSLAMVFLAFGQTPRITMLLVGFGVSQLLAAVPVTPGGLGVVEGGMAGAFVTLGLAFPVATSIVLAYRLLEAWLPTAAGVPFLLRPPSPEGAR
jgi:putative heme transporter